MSMLIVLVGVLALGPSTPAKETLKVYVFVNTDDSGFVDEKSKRLTDSLADVKRSIARKAGPFDVVVVDAADAATITIELVSSSFEKTGETTSKSVRVLGGVSTTTKDDSQRVVRGILRAGTYETTISSERHPVCCWRVAAGYFQQEFAAWVKANQAKLREVQKRPQQ